MEMLRVPSLGRSVGGVIASTVVDAIAVVWSNMTSAKPQVGPSWTVTVRRKPAVRVEIEGKIYAMTAVLIKDEQKRRQILYDRNYWHAWDAISVFKFYPSARE